jgi:DNA phosphorothioation-dependent restriction protein DptG
MAHFAKLGVGNIVERVEVVSNDIATTEQAGVDFLNNLYKTRDVWKQTSYNKLSEKIMLVLVFIMTKQEMLLFLKNLLIVGFK